MLYIQEFWHSMVCIWRLQTGRYYVCRDRPTWFLERVIAMEDAAKEVGDEDILRLIADAKIEYHLRSRKGM